MVGRETHPVHQHLSLIEWAEVAGFGIAEPDDAEQFIIGGIGNGDRVRKLFGGVDAIAMADRYVGPRGSVRRLTRTHARRRGE